jgi:hypothetical protein
MINALVNDAMEYGKTHHEIDPVLESVGLKPGKAASPSTNKPAAK